MLGGCCVSTLEEILAPQIDLTIEGLKRKRFTADPISGKYSSKITSLISRARQGGARADNQQPRASFAYLEGAFGSSIEMA